MPHSMQFSFSFFYFCNKIAREKYNFNFILRALSFSMEQNEIFFFFSSSFTLAVAGYGTNILFNTNILRKC